MKELNILIAGVGGQGNILTSRILANVAISKGERVRIGETYGASQRGGGVLSHVRIGSEVFGPLISFGKGDVILGFEPMECVRQAVIYLKKDGLILCNTRKLLPIEVISGMMEYPEMDFLWKTLRKISKNTYLFDATELAEKAGDSITLNMVMLGALQASGNFPFEKKDMLMEIRNSLKKKIEVNERAFELGFKEFLKLRGNEKP
ncbi:MAG: indolepyruvate oxidoreductase subunit beta [Candidatus Methanofastidiosia archaeon]